MSYFKKYFITVLLLTALFLVIGMYNELKIHYQSNQMHTLIGPRIRVLNSNVWTNTYALLLTVITAVYLGSKSFTFIKSKRKTAQT